MAGIAAGVAGNSKASDGGSALADALQRAICLDPVGEKVAVLTDALSGGNGPCPDYGEVCEIGHFCVENDEYVDSAAYKRYLRVSFPPRHEWDLDKGYSRAHRRIWPSRGGHLLHWVRLNKDKLVSPPPSDEERHPTALEAQSSRMVFVCGRFTLRNLLLTPYAANQAWLLGVCRYRDFVYMYNCATESKDAEGSHDERRDHARYWGTKFHHIMTTKEPGGAPDNEEVLKEAEAYTVVLRSELGSHSIVLGGEVKAVDPSVECEPGSTASYVEFKVTLHQGDSTNARRDMFKRHVMLAWWAQCRLAGVPRAICGYRNDDGILVNIEDIDVNDMPKMAGGKWSEDKCMRFCDRLLSFIKQHVKVDDGRTVYLFEYMPRSRKIVCKRLRDPGETYRPRRSLPEVFGDCGSVQTT